MPVSDAAVAEGVESMEQLSPAPVRGTRVVSTPEKLQKETLLCQMMGGYYGRTLSRQNTWTNRQDSELLGDEERPQALG